MKLFYNTTPINEIVFYLLSTKPELRFNDMELIKYIWKKQASCTIRNMKATTFLDRIGNSNYARPDTIIRYYKAHKKRNPELYKFKKV